MDVDVTMQSDSDAIYKENTGILDKILDLSPGFIQKRVFETMYPKTGNAEIQHKIDSFANVIVNSVLNLIQGQLRIIAEKERIIAEKERIIVEKERTIVQQGEASVIATALVDIKRSQRDERHLGSLTRARLWTDLQKDGAVTDNISLPQSDPDELRALEGQFSTIDPSEWTAEVDMYGPIIEAMQTGLYHSTAGPWVVDTHQKGTFRADISVADFEDNDRLIYALRYFLELKLTSASNLLTPENCGQVIDYIYEVHRKQPHRSAFVAILSNYTTSYVFVAEFRGGKLNVSYQAASSLADAILSAESFSTTQYSPFPNIPSVFSPSYEVLAVARHHFVFSVPFPNMNKLIPANLGQWSPPKLSGQPRFALKIGHETGKVTAEIEILQAIKNVPCQHLPEVCWVSSALDNFGITPVGVPIQFDEPADVSRAIVAGLIDGLNHLHEKGIVHRDIRPSNLVVHFPNKVPVVVIIDYETATQQLNTQQQYQGGFICWPKGALQSGETDHVPHPSDDLHAALLVVLHMLFPNRFHSFRASSIGANLKQAGTTETQQLLQLWSDLKSSKVWGKFVGAAEALDYAGLKEMSDVFYHV